MKTACMNMIERELENPDNIDHVGVTFTGGIMKEVKCYRFDDFRESSGVHDFATAVNTNSSRKYFRIKPEKGIDYEKIIQRFVTEKNCIVSPYGVKSVCNVTEKEKLRVRLSLLGIQNLGENEQILKAYFSLRSFQSETDVVGKKQSFYELEDIFQRIEAKCQMKWLTSDFMKNISISLQEAGFYPSLLGINQMEEKAEFKLYYELFQPDCYFKDMETYSRDILMQISKRMKCPYEEFFSVNDTFDRNGYFVRGIAFSNLNSESGAVLRLYFAPKNRFV